MDQTHIALAFTDGRSEAFDTSTYLCLADRSAFAKQFGQSTVVMADMVKQFDEKGRLRPDADADAVNEDWFAFLVWRAWSRTTKAPTPFEEFLDQIAEIDIGSEEPAADPLAPAETGVQLASTG